MSSSTHDNPSPSPDNGSTPSSSGGGSSKAKWQLNLMIIMTVIPIVLAYTAYYTGIGVPTSTVNQGSLLSPPVTLSALSVVDAAQLPDIETDRKWRLFIPVPALCNEQCQAHLYVTRQVNIRLANKADRVERFAVSLGGESSRQFLSDIAEDYPRLHTLNVTMANWRAWLASTNLQQDLSSDHYYLLVDPMGNAMMFYDQRQDGNQLLKDIKRILRHTPEE